MRWTEGRIHVVMRQILANRGWQLLAGEFPGGSDHELYPLNVVDPAVARDESPDSRRHSQGELIPDLVALHERKLFIGEAKMRYDSDDRRKLELLVTTRRDHLLRALRTFSEERGFPQLLPVETLILCPTLVFLANNPGVPPPSGSLSYLRIVSSTDAFFEGLLKEESL